MSEAPVIFATYISVCGAPCFLWKQKENSVEMKCKELLQNFFLMGLVYCLLKSVSGLQVDISAFQVK